MKNTEPHTGIAFRPGELWLDTNGVPINAHGGVLFHEGTYYWFGEHKIAGEEGNRAHVGVSVYTSRDLYAWTNAGVALAVSDDPASEIVRGCVLERPKVIFNRHTGKFVMWFHLEPSGLGYAGARSGVAVADQPAGPYRYLPRLSAAEYGRVADERARRTQASTRRRRTRAHCSIRSSGRTAALLSEGRHVPPRFPRRPDGA
jgi:hypothetical protein